MSSIRAKTGRRKNSRRSPISPFCLSVCLLWACQDGMTGLTTQAAELTPAHLPASTVINFDENEVHEYEVDGFSPPETFGTRRASWSDGSESTLTFKLRGDADRYLVAFLGEPYHAVAGLTVNLSVNAHSVARPTLAREWRAYQFVVPGDLVTGGRNVLSFQYSKTARPSDVNPRSTDMRELGIQLDQVQFQPITQRARLLLNNHDALALAALNDGWARDPRDRASGVWTLGERASLTFHLADPKPVAHNLSLLASAVPGVPKRPVSLTINGYALPALTFEDKRGRLNMEIPPGRLRGENELVFAFDNLESPADLDPRSKDTRSLGLRVFELLVAPK